MKTWGDWLTLVCILLCLGIAVRSVNWMAVLGWVNTLLWFVMSCLWKNLAKERRP